MELLEKIRNCKEDEIDDIILKAIIKANENSEKKESIGCYGFLPFFQPNKPHKGFINKNTKICFAPFIEPYEVKATDYFYEFARYIRKININNKHHLYCCILQFCHIYFFNNRDTKDYEKATKLSKYKNIKDLGDFKENNRAACLEFSILAQNLLSLFGFETYICFGWMEMHKNEENFSSGHVYNVIKMENDYIILDYTNPVYVYNNNQITHLWLFEGYIKEEELSDFLNGNIIKEFKEYVIINQNMEYQYKYTEGKRKYFCYKIPMLKETKNQIKTKKHKLTK